MNKTLSICIPTYNRADKLLDCIEHLIPQIRKYDIPIYISDNASTDRTKEVVTELTEIYPLIFYSCSQENFGADYNIGHVQKLSKSSYAWLLGDDDRIARGAIDNILKVIESNSYDLVVVNGGELDTSSSDIKIRGRINNTDNAIYNDRNELLSDLGWYMTWISCLILSSNFIANAKFDKYQGTSLVHFGAIFDYLSKEAICVYWYGKPLVYFAKYASSDYNDRIFEIVAKNWFHIVDSLPANYLVDSKLKCLKELGTKSNLITARGLYNLRKNGYYNYNIYKKYSYYFDYVTNTPKLILWLIALFPLIFMQIVPLIRNAARFLIKK